MSPLAVTSVTNLLLAGLVFALAVRVRRIPMDRFSAAWYFRGVLWLLGVAAVIGAADHGYFEPLQRPRYWIQRADWIVLAGVTFCLLMSAAKQFFPPRWQRVLLAAGVVQFTADCMIVLFVDSFLDVVLNYAPVVLLLLVVNLRGLKDGTGSRAMIGGLLVLTGASAIQAAGWDALSPLDHNGVYHVLSMPGAFFLYLGGNRLNSKIES